MRYLDKSFSVHLSGRVFEETAPEPEEPPKFVVPRLRCVSTTITDLDGSNPEAFCRNCGKKLALMEIARVACQRPRPVVE